MGIDVDELRIEPQIEYVAWVAAVIEHVAVAQAHGIAQQPVTDRATVDEPELALGGGLRGGGQSEPTAELQYTVLSDRQAAAQEFGAQNARYSGIASAGIVCCRQVQSLSAVMPQPECDRGRRQSQSFYDPGNVSEFGGFGTHELAACGHVVEQLAHFDRRALRVRGRLRRAGHSALDLEFRRSRGRRGTTADAQSRHRSHRRQRLATKPEAGHRLKIRERGYLAGGMALHGQRQFRRSDAHSVIAHAHQGKTALLDVDIDAPRTRVQRILDQFLDDGSRPLDDLARGDLVNQGSGQ